ncbi:MAG: hypothetical protein HPY52_11200 [Firmicutes bacterium]|nr:hypothetical protein [Bacillota bacterium]
MDMISIHKHDGDRPLEGRCIILSDGTPVLDIVYSNAELSLFGMTIEDCHRLITLTKELAAKIEKDQKPYVVAVAGEVITNAVG